MSEIDVFMHGCIYIDPPVDVAALGEDSPIHPANVDISAVRVALEAHGDVLVIGSGNGGDLTDLGGDEAVDADLQAIVDALGPGYTYTGMLQGEGPDIGDFWRLRVIDGRAVREDALVLYPADYGLTDDGVHEILTRTTEGM